jgi:glycosyltransferase involved in cell wall biosynthesis
VTDAEAGLAVDPGDPKALAQAMVAMSRMSKDELAVMGRNARAAYEARFGFSAAITDTLKVLDAALRERRGVRSGTGGG